MMKSKQTRFVLALLCALTISSTVFAKDTRYLRRVLTTDEEGTTQDLGKVRIVQLVIVLTGRQHKSQCTNRTFTKRREEKVATVLSNPKVQSLVRA